jgi:uncharacterized membrane protein YgcG
VLVLLVLVLVLVLALALVVLVVLMLHQLGDLALDARLLLEKHRQRCVACIYICICICICICVALALAMVLVLWVRWWTVHVRLRHTRATSGGGAHGGHCRDDRHDRCGGGCRCQRH